MQNSRRHAVTPAASATTTISASDSYNADDVPTGPTLRLRGADSNRRERGERSRRIQWAEDVVDNEGMGKKKSKGTFISGFPFSKHEFVTNYVPLPVCCIYHKPRPVGESSSEEDSSSSDSDSNSDGGAGNDDGSARPSGRIARNRRTNNHDSDHGDHCARAHDHGGARGDERKGKDAKKPSPNAYEKQPKAPAQSTKK